MKKCIKQTNLLHIDTHSPSTKAWSVLPTGTVTSTAVAQKPNSAHSGPTPTFTLLGRHSMSFESKALLVSVHCLPETSLSACFTLGSCVKEARCEQKENVTVWVFWDAFPQSWDKLLRLNRLQVLTGWFWILENWRFLSFQAQFPTRSLTEIPLLGSRVTTYSDWSTSA